jgi:hypothetical protein
MLEHVSTSQAWQVLHDVRKFKLEVHEILVFAVAPQWDESSVLSVSNLNITAVANQIAAY